MDAVRAGLWSMQLTLILHLESLWPVPVLLITLYYSSMCVCVCARAGVCVCVCVSTPIPTDNVIEVL